MQKQSILLRGSETHISASNKSAFQYQVRLVQSRNSREMLLLNPGRQEGIPSDGLVEQSSDILLLVAMGCAKDHHTVLNGQRIEMVQHDVIGLGEQGWVTRNISVLVKNNLEKVRRQDRWGFESLLRSKHIHFLTIRPWG